MAHDVFISYATKDKPVADAACFRLESRGIRCWIAPRDILPGLDRGEAVIEAIQQSRILVLIFSSHANFSHEVKRDVERGVNRGLAIIPFRIEDVPMSKSLEYFISVPHWLDALTPPLDHHLDVLVENIEILLSDREIRHPNYRKIPAASLRKQFRALARWTIPAALLFALVTGTAGFLLFRALYPTIQYERLTFTTATLDRNGVLKGRIDRDTKMFREKLGASVDIEMVEISGSKFWMGTSQSDLQNTAKEYRKIGIPSQQAAGFVALETPQGPVTVVSFYISRSEITQEQWARVSRLPEVNRKLNSAPSFFPGNKRPVEQISWEDAVEFCDRLSVRSGRPYRLPSEAEWEYACRAGTTTPFHYGEALTFETANFNAAFPWGAAGPASATKQTLDSGRTGYSNGFGIIDMHGNVQEWCADPWHPDYRNSPSGAAVWENGGDTRFRVIRGGSYLSAAAFCRCSARARETPDYRSSTTGFRIAIFSADVK